jgi:hypothetical protein
MGGLVREMVRGFLWCVVLIGVGAAIVASVR